MALLPGSADRRTAFAIVAVNNGPDHASDAQATVTLPTGATYQSHTASTGDGAYDPDSGV